MILNYHIFIIEVLCWSRRLGHFIVHFVSYKFHELKHPISRQLLHLPFISFSVRVRIFKGEVLSSSVYILHDSFGLQNSTLSVYLWTCSKYGSLNQRQSQLQYSFLPSSRYLWLRSQEFKNYDRIIGWITN